jgi:hypothetical protein
MGEYAGRTFIDKEGYQVIERRPALISENKVWLYTVDKYYVIEEETGEPAGKVIIRIVRWRARNADKDKHKKYWKLFRSYNIRSSTEWNATSSIVNDMIADIGISATAITLNSENPIPTGDDATVLRELSETIDSMRNLEIAQDTELKLVKQKLKLMKAEAKKYEIVLSDFKKLIEKDDSTESDVHKFIAEKKAFWLFGLDYVAMESKKYFPEGTTNYQFDLMLKRQDGFWDLVELKGPNNAIFDKRTTRRSKPNAKLAEAIGQVFAYLYACDIRQMEHIFKPTAYIVIGKKKTDRIEERRLFASYISNVRLMTYSELHDTGKRLIEYIKNGSIS